MRLVFQQVLSWKISFRRKFLNKVVEVLLNVKGQEVFAKKNAKKFEEAVDELYDVVKRQLVKIKEKEREC